MTQSALIDISPAQDGGVLKEIRREGPDPDDKPWKGDRVQVKDILSKHLILHYYKNFNAIIQCFEEKN